SHVTIHNTSPTKRPTNAYVDGIHHGIATSLRARLSRAASVELAFLTSHDMAEKIADIQFMNWKPNYPPFTPPQSQTATLPCIPTSPTSANGSPAPAASKNSWMTSARLSTPDLTCACSAADNLPPS